MGNLDRRFLLVLWLTLAVKLFIAAILPMTGDEAYFIVWGNHPDYGFYDHTPMVGWILAAMLSVSDAELWLRLPQIMVTTFIGWGIYQLVRRQHEDIAVMVAVLYLLAPINILGVLITTDTPLIFWSFLSAACFYFAQRHDSGKWYLLSGIFLGLAFFSKYFAGLLGVAYFLYTLLFVRRGVQPWKGILWIIAGTLPFIGLNLWWNYNHCWNNVLFNLYNRTSGNEFSFKYTVKYLVTVLYLVTPPIIYYLIRDAKPFVAQLRTDRFNVFMGLILIPYGLFLLLSFWVSIGLHWLLSFYAFIFIAIATVFTAQQLRRSFYFMLPFSVLHVVLIITLVAMAPGVVKTWVNHGWVKENSYKDVVYGIHADEIFAKIKPYQGEFVLATDSYTESALLSYAGAEHIMVFGVGSHHARQDDMITDFRKLDGKNILVVSYSNKVKWQSQFFERSEIKSLPIAETNYYLFKGYGFNYQKYRERVIEEVLDRFYTIPDYLLYGSCNMYDWYGRSAKQMQRLDEIN